MAKSFFSCAKCGVDVAVQGRNTADANGRASWMAKKGEICAACRCAAFAAANASAVAASTEAGLAPLVGTEKQVAWASSIRLAALPLIAEAVRVLLTDLDKHLPDTDLLSPAGRQEIGDSMQLIATEMRDEKLAAWWIEHGRMPTASDFSDRITQQVLSRLQTLAPTAHADVLAALEARKAGRE